MNGEYQIITVRIDVFLFGARTVVARVLMPGIRFMQRIRQEGSAIFCYNAVRPLGEDFEESVGYNFTFLEGGVMDESLPNLLYCTAPLPPFPISNISFSG